MEITIEIDNDDIKEIIKSELSIIEHISNEIEATTNVIKLIVPDNFDKTVRELLHDKSYTSSRGQLAIAKIIETAEGIIIVFHKDLYLWEYNLGIDYQVRCIIYLHEIIHAINKQRFPIREINSGADCQYIENMHIFYDEYYANRLSFEIADNIFAPKTYVFKKHICSSFKGFLDPLIDSNIYFNKLKLEIVDLNYHCDIKRFLNAIVPIFDEVGKNIVYLYSYIDSFHRLKRIEPYFMKSRFINKKTISLIEYFRNKYSSNDLDLSDRLHLMENFMTNFGIRFKDGPNGLICQTLDI